MMKKISGILLLLVYVFVASTLLNDRFVGAFNMQNITRWSSLFGILGIGVAFVIITGGIDLSIGSVVGLIGCLLPMMLLATESWAPASTAALTFYLFGGELLITAIGWLTVRARAQGLEWRSCRAPALLGMAGVGVLISGAVVQSLTLPAWVGVACVLTWVLAVSIHLGLFHGLLVTRIRLQPFVVTLCGLLIYRGLSRWLTKDQTQGFGTAYDQTLRLLATGKPCSVAFVVFLAGLVLASWAAWKWWSDRDRDESQRHPGLAIFGIVAGLVVTLIGAARFLPLPEGGLAGLSAEQLPAAIMNVAGWLVVPSAIWLLFTTLRARARTMAGPLVALIVTSGLLLAAMWVVRQPDEWFFGGRDWAARFRMASVFVTLGALMCAVAWLGKAAVAAAGRTAYVPLAASASTALAWLVSRTIGKTSLAETLLGEMRVPAPFFVLVALGVVAAVFLNRTIYGRYLLALGRNEQAARFSGIKTDRLVVLAYVICSGAAGLGGILFALDGNSVQPSGHGNLYELYAIAAAVLGGCSLRGGEASILGVVIGATVVRVLYNSINILGIASQLEYTVIGVVILAGVIVDELVKRWTARRLAKAAASN